MNIGVLALQGDVPEHLRMLSAVGVKAVEVRRAGDLEDLAGLVIPGGESTTIGKLAVMYDLIEPIREAVSAGMGVLGTCAGAILLSRKALLPDGGRADQPLLGALDVVVRRNAFGRQVDSFETTIDVAGIDGPPMHAVFIRAPWFEETGLGVEVLAKVETPLGDKVVVVRQGRLLAAAFHPELSGDTRLHRMFAELVDNPATGGGRGRVGSQ